MSADARTLYPAWVRDHERAPRNLGGLESPTHAATCTNPLCGDRVTVRLRVLGDAVETIRFEAVGCAIARASASRMTELMHGAPVDRVRRLANRAVETLGSSQPLDAADPLAPWSAVRDFPTRRRCATLPFEAVASAMKLG